MIQEKYLQPTGRQEFAGNKDQYPYILVMISSYATN